MAQHLASFGRRKPNLKLLSDAGPDRHRVLDRNSGNRHESQDHVHQHGCAAWWRGLARGCQRSGPTDRAGQSNPLEPVEPPRRQECGAEGAFFDVGLIRHGAGSEGVKWLLQTCRWFVYALHRQYVTNRRPCRSRPNDVSRRPRRTDAERRPDGRVFHHRRGRLLRTPAVRPSVRTLRIENCRLPTATWASAICNFPFVIARQKTFVYGEIE